MHSRNCTDPTPAPRHIGVPQVEAIAGVLRGFPKLREVGQAQLTALARQVTAVRHTRGDVLYRLGDQADTVYVVLEGLVALTDQPASGQRRRSSSGAPGSGELREEDMLHRCGPGDCVGDEELLLGVRWPSRVQILAPGEVVCRQGDAADCVWALVSGRCHVAVDPLHRSPSSRPPETDARRTTQIGQLQRGQLIGELSVFGSLRRRPATVRAATGVRLYGMRRALFVRACSPSQVEELRSIAEAEAERREAAKAEGREEAARVARVLRGQSLRPRPT
ncbi:hypothetical protein GPECTOR_156g90 [Gonium pectorale]|uniref:Cyclic nucleotide-binding domain-containing protein n=1 Tax=Gonium pectorale TaxID=33097 RepID=A0A150FXP1_GONPE|nr:hypothetical protein GPECTOR_156g90 [Gonium pectorale]|eukprot:KXZ42366.1 hypothetical protein GPECTOR_156g90 [Gonium pectorale]